MPVDIHDALDSGGGGLFPAGSGIHLTGQPTTVFAENAFATRRGDSLGPTLVRRAALLNFELPQGTVLYVGLFTRMPTRVGAGGTEVSVSGYARQPISSWNNGEDGASARRTNAVPLTWSPFGSAATIVGWGIWPTLSGGVVRDIGFLRAVESGDPITQVITAGGQPGFAPGDIGLVF